MGNGCCKHKQNNHEIVRTNSGKILNRIFKKQRKFRTGLHVEKTSAFGAEANFQAALTTDIEEKYSNYIPRVTELLDGNSNGVRQEPPQLQDAIQQNNQVLNSFE